jgi:S-adenosylmethionine hydrolase
MVTDTSIEGHIIFIDSFENVITNISRKHFEEARKGRNFSIVFKRDEIIDRISETYADVREGENWHYLIAPIILKLPSIKEMPPAYLA